MSVTYLVVPFREKDAAKSLGARWDGQTRQWYVPEGREIAPFNAWLPIVEGAQAPGTQLAAVTPTAVSLQSPSRGVPLSHLLAGVAATIAESFKGGVWTTAEVMRADIKGGHVYSGWHDKSEIAKAVDQVACRRR